MNEKIFLIISELEQIGLMVQMLQKLYLSNKLECFCFASIFSDNYACKATLNVQ
jgi:hypothetical protein